jgi:transcriptional regulator with XRE-family HTH domain
MERKFYINWQAFSEEAKQRRKKQKLTQQQLAKLAKISTPTISRFENGEKDIQLSSILNILRVLGMVDQRRLDFPRPLAKYLFDRGVVRFIGQDDDKEVVCVIGREALADYFHGEGQDPLKTFKANQSAIEHEARRKYIAGLLEVEGIVFIKSEDLL